MSTKDRFYWDSCVFIDWIQKDKPDRVELLQPIITAALAEEVVIVTSAFTLAEVIRVNNPNPLSEDDEKKILQFFQSPFISVRNVDRKIARRAREVCRIPSSSGMRLKPPDAVHVATALEFNVPVLHTFDENHLIRFHEVFGSPLLKIEIPSYTPPPKKADTEKETQSPLFPELGFAIEAEVTAEKERRAAKPQSHDGDGIQKTDTEEKKTIGDGPVV